MAEQYNQYLAGGEQRDLTPSLDDTVGDAIAASNYAGAATGQQAAASSESTASALSDSLQSQVIGDGASTYDTSTTSGGSNVGYDGDGYDGASSTDYGSSSYAIATATRPRVTMVPAQRMVPASQGSVRGQ